MATDRLLAPTPRADSSFIETPTEKQVAEGPSAGDGCWKGFLASPHLKSWFLSLGLWALIVVQFVCLAQLEALCTCDCFWWGQSCPDVADCENYDLECGSPCDFTYQNSWAWYLCFGLGYLLYLVECYFAGSHKFLRNSHVKETIYQFVKRVQENRPSIWWKVECYHYETRTRTVTSTDANGRTTTRTETYQERVVTWRASTHYQFNTWTDVSVELTGLENYKLTKLYCSKTWTYADKQTEMDYNAKCAAWKAANNRDTYQDFSCGIEIPGYISHLLAEVQPGVKPACLDTPWYWIWSVFTFTVFFRHWFDSIVGRKKYTFVKQISIL